MISIKQLKDKLQNDLNDSSNNVCLDMPLGVSFKLFTDTGRYKKATRQINDIKEYINGIFSVTSSNISNASTGIEYGTITARCELLVKCNEEKSKIQLIQGNDGSVVQEIVERDNERWLEDIRTYLDEMFAEHKNFTLTDKQGFSYEVSATYSMAISGNKREQIVGVGDSYTFIFFVYYNIVGNGENSRTYKIYLDGKEIPYGTMTLRRVPTQTAGVYSGQKIASGKSIDDNNVFGISIECPAFISQTNDVIKSYIMRGENNVAHILTLILNEIKENYLVIFGEVDSTSQGVLNVGLMVSFVETVAEYGIISFPEYFNLYENKKANTITFSKDKTIYNVTKKEFTNSVSNGDFVATYDELSGLTQI